jgi:hypothetical protein
MSYKPEYETKSQWQRRLDELPAKPSKKKTKTNMAKRSKA